MRIEQVMHDCVVTCGMDDRLGTAARLMWDQDCGALPVLDRDGRVVAMITDRDICMAAYTQGRRLDEIPVNTAMSRELVTCSPDDSIGNAEKLMSEHQVRRLPVVDPEGRPLGIVTLNDLANASRLLGHRMPAADSMLLRTFAEIGGPHRLPVHVA
jgi:CBS domain-containing protein